MHVVVVTAVALFVTAAVAVVLAGPRMARTADGLARATGMGGALFGVVFLSLATDLPELTLAPIAVLNGHPRIAVGGLLGSAAAQLLLIAIVDIFFRQGKLAGVVSLRTSVGQCGLMVAVLAVPLVVSGGPVWGRVGIGTVVLPIAYLGVLAALRGIDTDEPPSPSPIEGGSEEASSERPPTRILWLRFGGLAVVLAAAGVALESSTTTIGSAIGLSETAAGALLAGVVTSLPELVTAVSAARNGALELAVGDLVGSSALDVTLVAAADAFHADGSLFDLLARPEFTLVGIAMALTAVLIVGLARRERRATGLVSLESWLMLGIYAGGAVMLVTSSG